MSHVFISYARSTARESHAVAAALRGLGYGVWLDDEIPAHRAYAEVIEERLRAAKAVVVIWSAEAVKSLWVQSEADQAREQGKLIQLSLDGARLPMPFDRIQCADMAGWAGDIEAPGWRKVLASLSELIGPLAATSVRSSLPRGVPTSAEPLLAVLAFDNLSGDEDLAYFSDGMSEEIQQTVARGAQLKVIGRTSSFQFRGRDKVIARVAAELNATHVLDGAVRRNGPRVRISAQLIECAGQTTLWSDHFDGDLTDVFALQDKIAAVVANALLLTFAPAARAGKIDPDAYDLYLRARAIGSTPLTIADEVNLLEQAVSHDPNFAGAWARLAVARTMEARWSSTPETYADGRRRATEAADRASALDPTGATVFLARGLLEPSRHFEAREALLDKALKAAPSDSDILRHASNFAGSVGRFREAYRLTELASEVDPINLAVVINTAGTLADVGLVKECYQAFEAARSRWPDHDAPVVLPLLMAAHFRDWEIAQPLIEIAKERKGSGYRRALLTVQLYRAPIEETRKQMRETVERRLAASGSVDLPTILFIHSVGLVEEAFEAVARSSFDDRLGSLERIFMIDIIFGITNADMRNDPRFVRLCMALGLCDYWVKADRWPDCADDGALPYDFKAEARRLAA
jgi:adenylate cyclase